jgi:hypothetical protein
MALWAVAFLGSTPIGGPIAGLVSDHLGGRGGLALGALTCLVAAALGLLVLRRPPGAGIPVGDDSVGVAAPARTGPA